MASSISALNSLLLNPYTQTALQDAQYKGGVNPLKPGAAVTARYTVGDDGELVLRDLNVDSVKVIDPIGRDNKSSKRDSADEAPKRRVSFADITPPKNDIGPSDQVALFAANPDTAQELPTASNPRANVIEAQYEEIGNAPAKPQPQTVAEQQQQKVANLYARNLDIIYNIIPLYSGAA